MSTSKDTETFSFADHAEDFDSHIARSIPGYGELRETCVGLSRWYIQDGTSVVDLGCSTGTLLRSIRDANQAVPRSVKYIGIDLEPAFDKYWRERRASNVEFAVADVRSFSGLSNMSLALSLFTIQFLPERDKLPVLRKVHDGAVNGGGLIIAEKVLANSAKFQDVLTFDHYDFKRSYFSEEQILEKEKGLRGYMTPWTESELNGALRAAGFREIQTVWRRSQFVALLALKDRLYDQLSSDV